MALDDILNEIDAENGGNFEAFEAQYEEEIQNFSRMLKRQGVPAPQRKQMVVNKMANMVVKGRQASGGVPQPVQGRIAANFDIVLKSYVEPGSGLGNTTTPVMIFGTSQAFSGYPDINSVGLNASNLVDRILTNIGSGKDMDFIANGGKSIVTVNCNQAPYTSLVMAIAERPIKISKLRMKVETGNETQLSVQLKLYKKTMFGTQSVVDLPSSASSFSPMQYQTLIVDIDGEYTIDKDSTLCIVVTGKEGRTYTTTLSMWVAQ